MLLMRFVVFAEHKEVGHTFFFVYDRKRIQLNGPQSKSLASERLIPLRIANFGEKES